MERLNSKIHQKYTALKKRKLLDEGLEQKREEEFEELCNAYKDWLRDLEKDNSELHEKLVAKQDELEKTRQDILTFKDWLRDLEKDNSELHEKLVAKQDELEKARQFLEDIRTRDSEIQMLKHLLDVKAEKSNSKTKTPLSHGKVKRVQLSENDHHSSPTEESQELECSTRHTCISGNRTDEIPSARMLCSLLQSIVRMKISVHDETEIFSISVSHEASGYSFTLTWLEESDEWSYKLSSLGTLERIAAEWMRT